MTIGRRMFTDAHKTSLKLSGTSSRYLKGCVGEKNHNWKDQPKYQAIHSWIKLKHGHANRCENRDNNILDFECRNNSQRYVWALTKGKEYKRDITFYSQLCQSCNIRLDISDNKEFSEKCRNAVLKRWRKS